MLTNKRQAGVLRIAQEHGVPSLVFGRQDLEGGSVAGALRQHRIDFVVLAGFLWLMPPEIVEAYQGRMVNVHPALLPKYGGKKMYGERVHQAVSDSADDETGITIHYVNQNYDEGAVIAQFKCAIEPESDPDLIASRAHNLEMEHYPEVILSVINNLKNE